MVWVVGAPSPEPTAYFLALGTSKTPILGIKKHIIWPITLVIHLVDSSPHCLIASRPHCLSKPPQVIPAPSALASKVSLLHGEVPFRSVYLSPTSIRAQSLLQEDFNIKTVEWQERNERSACPATTTTTGTFKPRAHAVTPVCPAMPGEGGGLPVGLVRPHSGSPERRQALWYNIFYVWKEGGISECVPDLGVYMSRCLSVRWEARK